MLKKGFLLILLTLIAVPVLSQDGAGLVVERIFYDGALNPIQCTGYACQRITAELFPTLYAVDAETGQFVGAADDNYGLAVDPVPNLDGEPHLVTLRDDLAWSDGTPITAYDVFFSYLAITQTPETPVYEPEIESVVRAMLPIDEQTLAFVYFEAHCSVINHANFPVIPVHEVAPDFMDSLPGFSADEDIMEQYEAYLDDEQLTSRLVSALVSRPLNSPTATSGRYQFVSRDSLDDIRLQMDEQAVRFRYLPNERGSIEWLLSGETNVLLNPAYEQRDRLLARADIRTYTYPGQGWYGISLNLADPANPESGYYLYGDSDIVNEQGHHPIFGDVRVRQAIQRGINVDELIERAFFGHASPISASGLPQSWAHNADIAPVGYDPLAAEELLYQAGWKDANRDGVRECLDCLYERPGQSLYFILGHEPDERARLMALSIARQLRPLGIAVDVFEANESSLTVQDYDAFLFYREESYPVDPDWMDYFSREQDLTAGGLNTGSYHNAELEDLMQAARTVPGCDVTERAERYAEIQQILQEDQPYIWLVNPHDMLVTSRGVQGANPIPGAPFWNMSDWLVTR